MAGPDGNLWFTEGFALHPQNIASINPTTGVITEYPVNLPVYHPWGITIGPDGNLWFTEGRALATVGFATLASSELVVTPAAAGQHHRGQLVRPDGRGRGQFGPSDHLVQRPGHGGAGDGYQLLWQRHSRRHVTVTASDGVATFSGLTLSNTTAGDYYSLYTSGGGYGWGVTNTITVTPAAASQLVITTQPPATVKVSTGFGLQASIEDQYGNVVTTATNTVKVAFANNPTGGTLGGTLSVTASQGVATFSGLTSTRWVLATRSSSTAAASARRHQRHRRDQDGQEQALSGTTANGPIGVISFESRVDPSPASLAIGTIEPAATPIPALPDAGLVAQALDSPGLLNGLPLGRRRR